LALALQKALAAPERQTAQEQLRQVGLGAEVERKDFLAGMPLGIAADDLKSKAGLAGATLVVPYSVCDHMSSHDACASFMYYTSSETDCQVSFEDMRRTTRGVLVAFSLDIRYLEIYCMAWTFNW
jgi:hypothetical protein